MSNTLNTASKEKARDQINQDVEAFLKRGEKIEQLPCSLTKSEKKYAL